MRTLVALLLSLSASTTAVAAMPVSRADTCEQLLANGWLRNVVIDNLNRLNDFPDNWALASQQIMHELILLFQNPQLDFVYFERFFRQEGIPLYLVANSEPLRPGLRISYTPGLAALKGDAPPKYHLWVGVQRPAEAEGFKAHLGLTDEENLRRLAETGFIFVLDIEAAARNPQIEPADPQTVRDVAKTKIRRPFDPEDN